MLPEKNALQHYTELTVGMSHQRPVVAMVWGTTCAPCALLKPKLQALSDRFGFPLVLIQAEKAMPYVREFKVRAVPTVLVFNRGSEVLRFTGDRPEDEVRVALAKVGAFQQPLTGV